MDARPHERHREGAFRLDPLTPRWRLPLLALGFAGLLVGVGAGLASSARFPNTAMAQAPKAEPVPSTEGAAGLLTLMILNWLPESA